MHINLTFTYQGRAGSCANDCLLQCSWRGKELLAVQISSDDFITGRDEYKMWLGVVDLLTMTLRPFQSQKECQRRERTYMNSTDFLCPVAVLLYCFHGEGWLPLILSSGCGSLQKWWRNCFAYSLLIYHGNLFCLLVLLVVGYFLDRVCLWSSICFYSSASAFYVLG